jgi:hypothetical protein
MKVLRWFLYPAVVAGVLGCGGDGGGNLGPRNSEVSGIVTNFNGEAVRGARVWINQFGETDSNSGGSYVLERISEGEWRVRAEVDVNGVRYRGENLAQVFESERSRSVNITVVRESQAMRVFGKVVDNLGRPLQGARVFAMAPNDGGVYTSTTALTDAEGDFDLDTLQSNVDYRIVASGLGYNSDVDVVNVAAGDSEELLLALKNPTNDALPAPTGLDWVSWVTPREETRSRETDSAYENVKRRFDPRTPQRSLTRDSSGGNYVEADLFWDPYPNNDSHIGFGVYRRFAGDIWRPADFIRDPEAEMYVDLDSQMLDFDTIDYVITAINTVESESADSNQITVETLDDLETTSVLQGPVRFRWLTGSGGEEFIVYLFDEYPTMGNNSIWDNASSPVGGTELTYTGPALQSGHRYYYIVLGLANSQRSRTLSRVESFVAN